MYFEYLLLIRQVGAKWMAKIVSWLINDVEYLKTNKNWYIMVFRCLNHDEMIRSRICMSNDVSLSNMLFSAVHFAHTWWMEKKYSKYM